MNTIVTVEEAVTAHQLERADDADWPRSTGKSRWSWRTSSLIDADHRHRPHPGARSTPAACAAPSPGSSPEPRILVNHTADETAAGGAA